MIEKSLYDKIVLLTPIVGVEAMIVNDDNEILFLKRNNPPVKGGLVVCLWKKTPLNEADFGTYNGYVTVQ